MDTLTIMSLHIFRRMINKPQAENKVFHSVKQEVITMYIHFAGKGSVP